MNYTPVDAFLREQSWKEFLVVVFDSKVEARFEHIM